MAVEIRTAIITTLIGLDVEFDPITNCSIDAYGYARESRIALLQLCDGKQCLILPVGSNMPNSVYKFLRLAEATFIGMGIKENTDFLRKRFGVVFRNILELKEYVAAKYDDKDFLVYGVDELISRICPGISSTNCKKSETVLDGVWGLRYDLNDQQALEATLNPFKFWFIADTLKREWEK